MFQIGTPWEGGLEARTLAAIPETGPEPDQAAAAAAERVRLVGCCMTFLLGLSKYSSHTFSRLPAGAASPQTPNPTRNPGCALSHKYLIVIQVGCLHIMPDCATGTCQHRINCCQAHHG